jgi:hypothetical protein
MKYVFLTILLFLSSNLFSHDFIWGERIDKFIEKNGSPDIYEDFNNDGLVITLTYNYSTYKRTCYFANRQFATVIDEYGPFNERQREEAIEIAMMLYNRFTEKYIFVGESNDGFNFKYGNDSISLKIMLSNNINRNASVIIFYVSPLMRNQFNYLFE